MEIVTLLIHEFTERIDSSINNYEQIKAETKDRRKLGEYMTNINELKALKRFIEDFNTSKDF